MLVLRENKTDARPTIKGSPVIRPVLADGEQVLDVTTTSPLQVCKTFNSSSVHLGVEPSAYPEGLLQLERCVLTHTKPDQRFGAATTGMPAWFLLLSTGTFHVSHQYSRKGAEKNLYILYLAAALMVLPHQILSSLAIANVAVAILMWMSVFSCRC